MAEKGPEIYVFGRQFWSYDFAVIICQSHPTSVLWMKSTFELKIFDLKVT